MSDTYHDEDALGRVYDRRLISRLWRYVRPYGWQVGLTFGLVVPLFALETAPAWIVKTGLDRLVPGELGHAPSGFEQRVDAWLAPLFQAPEGFSYLAWLALLYFGVLCAHAAIQFFHSVLMATTGQNAVRDLRRDVFDRIQALHMGFFDSYPVGRLVTRATNDVENLAEMFAAGIVALVTDMIKMIGFAVVLYLINPKLALAAFGIVPVLAVAAVIFRLKVREAFREVRVKIARINAHIQETITGMKVVQLFTREDRNAREFDVMNADHRDAWQKSIKYDALLFSAIETATGITVAVTIWVGTGLAEPGVLYVFMQYMRRFFMPLRDLSAKYSVMQSSMASSERIFQLLDTPLAIEDAPGADARLTLLEGEGDRTQRGSVEFEHVWFRYGSGPGAEDGDDWILRDVSFRVAPGEKVAFVGATGAGKTTIIKLLTRLYEIDRGTIRIDGVDIREMPQRNLRRRVATVLQDVFLFSGTIGENIALGRQDIDEVARMRAAKAVEAHPFIERLPEGYETHVRERGTNFSSGQRQLLSFARALAHGADILVLDEATSSIDTETEAAIQRGIRALMEGKTAIAIAHRLSTIRDVDRIYVLHKGRLVEQGSHQELLDKGGLYERLYRLQEELGETGDAPALESA